MGHYASEMFITGSREGDEEYLAHKKTIREKALKAHIEKRLENNEITIDMDSLQEGDRLTVKDDFLSNKIKDENGGDISLAKTIFEGYDGSFENGYHGYLDKKRWFDKNYKSYKDYGVETIPLVYKGMNEGKLIVKPRGFPDIGGTYRVERRERLCHIDPKILQRMTKHNMLTTRVKDGIVDTLDDLFVGEKDILLKYMWGNDLKQYNDISVKELLDVIQNK